MGRGENSGEPMPEGRAPLTREQVEEEFARLALYLADAGRRAGEAVLAKQGKSAIVPSDAEADAMALAGVAMRADARASFILFLDEAGRIAECDRDELVAEARFVQADPESD